MKRTRVLLALTLASVMFVAACSGGNGDGNGNGNGDTGESKPVNGGQTTNQDGDDAVWLRSSGSVPFSEQTRRLGNLLCMLLGVLDGLTGQEFD